jgi:hypothetical protein
LQYEIIIIANGQNHSGMARAKDTKKSMEHIWGTCSHSQSHPTLPVHEVSLHISGTLMYFVVGLSHPFTLPETRVAS